jgi:hypothetical protein
MNYETKRDVLLYFGDYVLRHFNTPNIIFGGEQVAEYMQRYDNALPDDLPVIPKAWGDTIEEFKANHYRLSEIFTEWAWNYDEQELIARAWVLGVWRVEETGEIVKLEEEK